MSGREDDDYQDEVARLIGEIGNLDDLDEPPEDTEKPQPQPESKPQPEAKNPAKDLASDLAELKGKTPIPTGKAWKAPCPCHEDDGHALRVYNHSTRPGQIYINKCDKGCSSKGIRAECIKLGFWPAKPKTAAVIAWSESGIDWRELKSSGAPAASLENARLAITAAGITCRYDTFHHKIIFTYEGKDFGDILKTAGEGAVSDETILGLRQVLSKRYGFDLLTHNVRDAVMTLALEKCFDPVLDMLAEAEAEWDGVDRLDTMAATYLNAEDTLLNNTCLRKWMIAAVARVRNPGCKFDNILVLEGPEGWDKSTFFLVLAGAPENFSDEAIIGKAGREVQESLGGIWIHENAELGGMRKADIETVKAFASRQVDRARPTYGHFQRDQPRHSVSAGTTNKSSYLLSNDGNRRFCGMELVKPIDIEAFKRDRLLLLGEAAYYQRKGESLFLDKSLWGEAAIAQEARRAVDPWEDLLENLPEKIGIEEWNSVLGHRTNKTITIIHVGTDEEQVTINDILTHILKIPAERQNNGHGMKVSPIMKKLGWTKAKNKLTIGGQQWNGYARKTSLLGKK